MANNIRTIHTPEGTKYELTWEGKSKTFDDRQEADEVLVLHMAKDAGRQLSPDEESRLVGAEPRARASS